MENELPQPMARRQIMAKAKPFAIGTMTIFQACQFTGMKQSTIRKLIRCKQLRTTLVGRLRLVDKGDLERVLTNGMAKKGKQPAGK